MMLREILAVVSMAVGFIGTIFYAYDVFKKDSTIKPVIASWIVWSTTMSLSLLTYWTSPEHTWVGGAATGAGVLSTLTAFVVALCAHRRNTKERILQFTPRQKKTLVACALVGTGWLVLVFGFGGTGVVPNLLTQAIMLFGYAMTLGRLWNATESTESFGLWWCVLITSVLGLILGLVLGDTLALIYGLRSTPCTAVMLWLMYRIEWRHITPRFSARYRQESVW